MKRVSNEYVCDSCYDDVREQFFSDHGSDDETSVKGTENDTRKQRNCKEKASEQLQKFVVSELLSYVQFYMSRSPADAVRSVIGFV